MTNHFPADIWHVFKSISTLFSGLRQSRAEVGHGNVALYLITCAGYDDLGLTPKDSFRPIDSQKTQF